MSIREIPYRRGLGAICASCRASHTALCGIFTDSHRERLEPIGHQIDLQPRDNLFFQGSLAVCVYVVSRGCVMVERTTDGGRRQVLSFLHPGDFVGFTEETRYRYSVSALTDTTLCAFRRAPFVELCDEFPELKNRIGEINNRALAHAMDHIVALGQKSAHERLCFLLWQLERRQGVDADGSLELLMSRQDMADYLGLTIETVSRAFARLKRDGVIRLKGRNRVEFPEPDLLRQLATAS